MLGVAPIDTVFKCLDTVAVSAADLALSDLDFNSRPVKALPKQVRYFTSFLPANVVEFKEANVCLTAIDARVRREVSVKSWFVLNKYLSLTGTRAVLISLFIILVMEPAKF